MEYRVGIDVGGTFTDLTLMSPEGHVHVFKVPTRSDDIAGGCLDGLEKLLSQASVSPTEVGYWSHGSTVATNAVVERKGARMALLTTEGFRDVLEIRRQIKPDRYNLHRLKPEPLVPRDRRLEVRERILWDGSVYHALDEVQLENVLERLQQFGIEAVAICFLHSYTNPMHERIVKERVQRRLPTVYATASHEVLPEFREYPRCATTVTNAYVGPVIERYLERFDRGGRQIGIRPPLTIFQSNGGIVSASAAAQLPVKVLYSGPAAGVQGAVHVARKADHANVITFDMGGTSCDVCLVRDGKPLLTGERELAGYPLRTPMIDVHSIGAGGGSIAWVDQGGLLRVGPESAGADPGPACYGRGGTAATVTDANLVLGRLNPSSLLDGRLKIHAGPAHEVVDELAKQLAVSRERVALGIVDVVNNNMMGAIRVVSVERGYDYRDFVLVAFGGAGPLHASEVAIEMGIRTVLVPAIPGLLCAMGLLLADYRSDFTRTRIMPAKAELWEEIRGVFVTLQKEAQDWASRHGVPLKAASFQRSVHMRYVGQSYQLPVPSSPIEAVTDISGLVDRFHGIHEQNYGYAQPDAPTETVDFHLTLVAPVSRPTTAYSWHKQQIGSLDGARLGERSVWFKSSPTPVITPIYRRELLQPDFMLRGPAVIEQMDSTTLIPPEVEAAIDEEGNIRIAL